ncbi:MAG TPA: hypothetical protein VGL56_05630, partial [Fimbriimonadaceae bacterium]
SWPERGMGNRDGKRSGQDGTASKTSFSGSNSSSEKNVYNDKPLGRGVELEEVRSWSMNAQCALGLGAAHGGSVRA